MSHSQQRNPFGVQDVLDPEGEDIAPFAGRVRLTGSADDQNAQAWDGRAAAAPAGLEGNWSSRWNGEGFDWQQGRGKLSVDDRGFTSCETGMTPPSRV